MSMKKFTKKMLAIVAAGAMTMGLAMPVFAEGASTPTKEAYITKVFNTEVEKNVNFTFKAEQQKNGGDVDNLVETKADVTIDDAKFTTSDKTGTLTEGKLEINEVQACDGYDKAEILKIACSIESKSKHPIAHTFVQYKKDHSLELEEVENFESIAGKGLKGDINGQTYFIGNKTLFSQDINLENNKMSTTVIIGTENEIYGLITLKDKIRDETPSTIASLNAKGIKTTMITGDNEATAKLVADEIGLSNYYADLLPQDKVNIVSNAVSKHHDVAMVGDGVNDTPSLARANVGIAMGLEGADVAIETADIVLLEDKLSKINLLVDLAKKTMGKIKFNVAFCLSVKVILMILGIAGYISLWEAVLIGDMGITLLVVGNSLLLAK